MVKPSRKTLDLLQLVTPIRGKYPPYTTTHQPLSQLYTHYCLCIRHSDDMIKKLESAGLGFFIKEEETKQKLGMLLKWP